MIFIPTTLAEFCDRKSFTIASYDSQLSHDRIALKSNTIVGSTIISELIRSRNEIVSKLKYLNPGFYLFQSGKLHDVIRDWYFQPCSTLFQPCDWFEMIPFQSVWHDASITKVDFSVTKSITNFTFNVTKSILNNFPNDQSHNLGEEFTGPLKFIWSAMP